MKHASASVPSIFLLKVLAGTRRRQHPPLATALVRMSCLVIDAALKDAKDAGPQTVALDEAATLGELRRLIRRLPGLPSCAGRFHVCHDGSLLQAHAAHAPPRLTPTLTS